jgi:hypothetical protein
MAQSVKKRPQFPAANPQALRWLLRFAQYPLESFYPKSQEFVPEGELTPPDPELSPTWVERMNEEIERFLWLALGSGPGGRDGKLLAGGEIQSLYSAVKRGVTDVAAGKSWNTAGLKISMSAGSGWLRYDGNTHDTFLMTCLNLIAAKGELIARCARRGCGKLFFRQRHTRYCSRPCARKVENAQARKRRADLSVQERYEQRHAAYENSVKPKSKHSKVQVRRRGPRARKIEGDSKERSNG